MIEDVKIIEEYDGCVAYDCGVAVYVRLEKGAMASDHAHDHQETVFLMEGNAEVIIGDNIQTVLSPAKIIIPANAYHKFTALTDVIGLEIK